nr:DUF1848 family protein [Desulfobacteraceae bacterium]
MPSRASNPQLPLLGPRPRRAKPQYISASRRTDLPRFFHREFFAAWKAGEVSYDGGYGRSYTVSLRTEEVLGYIFISKDYAPFLADPRFGRLYAENNAIFHFTLNDCPELEPRVAPLAARLETFSCLCRMVGPERVLWRFDPVCKFARPGGEVRTTESAFFRLLPRLAADGISRCYFSFMSLYPKLKGRRARFFSFSEEEKRRIAAEMLDAAGQYGITLHCCCNPEVPALVPGILPARCVDGELLAATDRFGRHRALKPLPTRAGCGCAACRDIGSYRQRCPHGCLYCY